MAWRVTEERLRRKKASRPGAQCSRDGNHREGTKLTPVLLSLAWSTLPLSDEFQGHEEVWLGMGLELPVTPLLSLVQEFSKWSLHQQHRHHLSEPQKCRFPGPAHPPTDPDTLGWSPETYVWPDSWVVLKQLNVRTTALKSHFPSLSTATPGESQSSRYADLNTPASSWVWNVHLFLCCFALILPLGLNSSLPSSGTLC